MDDLIRRLMAYAYGAWRFRWWGLLAAWLVGIAGAIFVYVLPDKYEATARIYVDTQSVLAPLMSGLTVPTDVNQQVTMLSKTLISRPNVEKLIRMADLDLAAKSRNQREELISSVTKRLSIQSSGKDNLYSIAFMDTQPERAKKVVQSLVSIFIESGLGDKRKDSDSARRFIEDQIKSYAQKLDDAESRLKEFKLKNMALVGDSKDTVGQLSEINERLRQSRLELREVENSRDAIKRQLMGESPGGAAAEIGVPELDGRIETLKKQLDELRRSYTDNHPDVIGTRRVLADLERQRDEELKARKSNASAGTPITSTNPVYQQLKISLTDAEARVAQLKTRVAEFEARSAQSKELMRLAPQIEQELAQLNRDYAIHKQEYEQLVGRRESAHMSAQMESVGGVADFRLIDPPSVPSKPSAPNRIVMMPLVGLIALAVGAALTVLLDQIRPAFFDSRVLREATGLPILGSVSVTPNPERMRRSRRVRWLFVGGVGSLVSVFGALTVLLMLLGR
ncbi:XrtA system polysaccharide chain length determinant [Uliginosibacterium sp. H3]|uniref:XrtA system polysaccharide chain length determinant n=1 Tax=Uliginosibacterium silvisoli TaxID=3114758 RepID=A0ABU6K5P5_9RHOO|nr:XrtA system polysaccharide chain length determinant [Uliginosibacterium sp. H3]